MEVFIICAVCVWSHLEEESGLLPYLRQPSETGEEGGNEQGHLLFPS